MDFGNLFKKEGNWYKGNVHMHTTNSDGEHAPEEICRLYNEEAYDFLCIADHHRITAGFDVPEGMLLIPGAEMNNNATHVVGIGMKSSFDETDMTVQEMIDEINRQGAMAVIAHPYWSSLNCADLLNLENYEGMEVYNHTCHNVKGKGFSTVHFDQVLQSGRKLWGFASDDTHAKRDLFGSFLMVKAESLTEGHIMASLRQGCFYSSTGVLIEDLEVGDKNIHVRFSAASTADFIGNRNKGARVSGEGREIKEADYSIKGNEQFLRIEVTDKKNRKAWVNPLFM